MRSDVKAMQEALETCLKEFYSCAPQFWDTQEELEQMIAPLLGTTPKKLNNRLFAELKRQPGVKERGHRTEAIRKAELVEAYEVALKNIANLTLSMPPAYGNPEDWYHGQCCSAIGTAARALHKAKGGE